MNMIESLDHVSQLLSAYLTDNTESVFEELPEIDDARSIIEEVKSSMESVSKKWISLKTEIEAMEHPFDDERLSGFSEYEIDNDGELSIEWPNLKATYNALDQTMKTETN